MPSSERLLVLRPRELTLDWSRDTLFCERLSLDDDDACIPSLPEPPEF